MKKGNLLGFVCKKKKFGKKIIMSETQGMIFQVNEGNVGQTVFQIKEIIMFCIKKWKYQILQLIITTRL